jgi:hypothetical protein
LKVGFPCGCAGPGCPVPTLGSERPKDALSSLAGSAKTSVPVIHGSYSGRLTAMASPRLASQHPEPSQQQPRPAAVLLLAEGVYVASIIRERSEAAAADPEGPGVDAAA